MLSTLLVLALTAAGVAAWQRQEARDGQRAAVARTLLAQAEVARDHDPRSALQLAGAASTLDDSVAARASLVQTLASAPSLTRTVRGFSAGLSSMALGADGHLLATGSEDGTVMLWDIADAGRPQRVSGPIEVGDGWITGLALTSDARMLAVAGESGPVVLWDLSDPAGPSPSASPSSRKGTCSFSM